MQPYDASSPSGVETLTLTPDNPMNTTIASSLGSVLYTSTTESTNSMMFTRVHGASGEVLGSLEWRDVLSDRVILGDAPPVAFNDWIKKSLVPFREFVCHFLSVAHWADKSIQSCGLFRRFREKVQVEGHDVAYTVHGG